MVKLNENWFAEVVSVVSKRVARWRQWEKSPALRESERRLKQDAKPDAARQGIKGNTAYYGE